MVFLSVANKTQPWYTHYGRQLHSNGDAKYYLIFSVAEAAGLCDDYGCAASKISVMKIARWRHGD